MPTAFSHIRNWIASVLLLLPLAAQAAPDEITYEATDEQEFNLLRYGAEGNFLSLWLAPEYGFRDNHRNLAAKLAAEGIEVWQVDLVEDLFMPPGTRSLKQLEGNYVAELIRFAHETSGKKIVVTGDSYAAAIALRGARQWQLQSPTAPYLAGALLFSPYSYAYIPPLGLEPTYLPIVEATNIPLIIVQATGSATNNEFDTLLAKLGAQGNPVYQRKISGVMSLFYEDPPTQSMIAAQTPLASQIRMMLPLLAGHRYPMRAVNMAQADETRSGMDLYLREFNGRYRPGPLHLTDASGKPFRRERFDGQVTVINFWATWCPPCVEEIPSLNRLADHFEGRPFELISINYAQDSQTVTEFMQQVEVDFPVLLDEDGSLAKQWNVISFPSTFVIDSHGELRYGVNAAIDWDSEELISKLETLMP